MSIFLSEESQQWLHEVFGWVRTFRPILRRLRNVLKMVDIVALSQWRGEANDDEVEDEDEAGSRFA